MIGGVFLKSTFESRIRRYSKVRARILEGHRGWTYVGGAPGKLGKNERRTLTLLYFIKFCNFAMVYVLGGQDFENGIFDPISCSKSADRSAVLIWSRFPDKETFTKLYFTV